MSETGVRITHREMGSLMRTCHSDTQQSLKMDVVISLQTGSSGRTLEQLAQRYTATE